MGLFIKECIIYLEIEAWNPRMTNINYMLCVGIGKGEVQLVGQREGLTMVLTFHYDSGFRKEWKRKDATKNKVRKQRRLWKSIFYAWYS